MIDIVLPTLGIIAGNGNLPDEIVKLYTNNNGKCVVAYIGGEEKAWSVTHENFAIGSVGSILKYFKEQAVEEIIIIGGIIRPNLKTLKVDLVGSLLLAKIMKMKLLGDDNILRVIANYIEDKGFKVISAQHILKSGDYEKKIITKAKPKKQDLNDIKQGIQVLQSLGTMDVGQSVIAYNGYIIGIEAAEGTDNLIIRCAFLRKASKGGVLVKMHKADQDIRLDTPAIGPDTIINLAKNGFNGLAVEKSKVLIAQPELTLELLDKNGLFLAFI